MLPITTNSTATKILLYCCSRRNWAWVNEPYFFLKCWICFLLLGFVNLFDCFRSVLTHPKILLYIWLFHTTVCILSCIKHSSLSCAWSIHHYFILYRNYLCISLLIHSISCLSVFNSSIHTFISQVFHTWAMYVSVEDLNHRASLLFFQRHVNVL